MSSRTSWMKGHQLVLHEGARALIPAMVQALDQARISVHLEPIFLISRVSHNRFWKLWCAPRSAVSLCGWSSMA